MTVVEIVNAIKNRNLSAFDHVNSCLQNIEENKKLNAFLKIFPDEARQKAKEIDQRIKNSEKTGPLAGIVFAIKDNINIMGKNTTCASRILEPFVAPFNATVIEKLQDADAIFIGKTNLDEFAMGSSNENSAYGVVKNPWDNSKVPGGSSGGSAVAVASGCADLALGSDTGGSIRQPASFTGTVGLKPSYGRVSRYGLVAFASSLDQIGVFANNSQDAAYALMHIAGYDKRDSTSADSIVSDYLKQMPESVKGLRLGLPKEYFTTGLDKEINDGIMSVVKKLQKQGAEIVELSLSMTEYAIAMYYIIATAEASSNLARYDGVRYGMRHENESDLLQMYGNTRSDGFGDEVRRRIILGTYVLSAGYYDAYYKKAQQVRRLLKQDFENAFKKCDVIISPTTPGTAFKIGAKVDDPLQMYLTDIYTVSANLAGICALNIPAGKDSSGMPFGMQLQADAFEEKTLFQLGNYIENNIDL